MGTWHSLGVIAPTGADWQSYPALAEETETFRVISTWDAFPVSRCLLCQYFENGGRATFRRIYPSATPVIIELPIPRAYRLNALLSRQIQIKLRLPEMSTTNWQVEVEAYY